MRLRIFTEPQLGATYDQQLAIARCAEEEGFDAFFRSDHYLTMGGGDGLPGPTDAWVTLAGLARETTRIRLGTLVTSATFRLPGPLAIAVAQVDAMSGGRVELGLGAGWYDRGARGLRHPVPADSASASSGSRSSWRSSPACGPPRTGQTFDFAGAHYQLKASPALPKPAQQPRPPVIIGGGGQKQTPAPRRPLRRRVQHPVRLPGHRPRTSTQRVDRACEDLGRDPGTVHRSAAVVVCCGTDDAEIARRAATIGREVDELKANGACGTPDEVADRLREWAAAGAGTAYLQCLDLADLDHVRLIGREVAPLLT